MNVTSLPMAVLVLSSILGFATPAFAASEGELCGSFARVWSETCDAGLECDIRWRFGGLRAGICAPTTQICGGLQGATCPSGQFCDFGAEQACGAADQTGACTAIPEACTREYQPVCGCDDKTYGNACTAHAAGVAVASEGACAGSGCDYNGETHAVGDSFPDADGCNTCSCEQDGTVACTLKICVPEGDEDAGVSDEDGGTEDQPE